MQTFQEVSRTEAEVTFRYRTVFSYWMYGSVMAYVAALAFDAPRAIELAAIGTVFAYFVLVYVPSRPTTKKLQQAMKDSSLKMEGSRWSFDNPLQITVPVEFFAPPAAADSESGPPTGA